MIGSIVSNLEKESKSKDQNIKDNSSENTVELYHNSDDSDYGYVFNNEKEENNSKDDKPMLNINTLQSIRISHSIENSKNSQSLIDILNENKILNLNNNNDYEENNENDVNVNNKANKKIKNKFIKNKKEEKNTRNVNIKEYSPINSNCNKENNIYNKFKIDDIFKEKFEEKTKAFKSLYNNENNYSQKNKNILINEEIKPKTLEYPNNIKNSNFNKIKYISSLKKDINNELLNLKENDSVSFEPDSIETNDNINKNLIIDTFEIQNSSEKNDKNILVSELDYDITNSIQKNKNMNNVKIENSIENNRKNGISGNNHSQKQLNGKNKNINKKIYPIRKINLNNNIHKKNAIQLKKKLCSEKSNNKYKNYHPSSSIKIQKNKYQRNLDLKQVLNNSNLSSYYRLNTSTNKNKRTLYKKTNYTNIKPINSKPKISSKSLTNERNINLKKYYRLSSRNKNKNDIDLYNNIKKIITDSLNRNSLNQKLYVKNLNSSSNIMNNININSFKKNNSFVLNHKNNLNTNISNKTKKKTDIPVSYNNKISLKNKIPIKKNTSITNQKNKLYSNNNKIRNKINSVYNPIFHYNSFHEKYKRNLNNFIYDKNYYNLNQNEQIGNIYGNKDNNKIIINTVYNSFTNNIYPMPKYNFSKNKKHIGYNNNLTFNYLDNPLFLLNHTNLENRKKEFLYDKKVINSINNKSKNNPKLLTEYNLINNNKTINCYNKGNNSKNVSKKIINDKVKNKNYIRYFSNNLLKTNPFVLKEKKGKNNLNNKTSKKEFTLNKNKNCYSYRSSTNITKNSKNI